MNTKQSWRSFLALFHARNKEFLRDRGALSWSILLPVLIVVACTFAFSNNDDAVLSIGIIATDTPPALRPLLDQPYIQSRQFADRGDALSQLGYQRVDIIVSPNEHQYWVNAESNASLLAEHLLGQLASFDYQKQAVEGTRLRYIDWVLPGVLGMNMMFGSLFGAGYVIVRYRNNGVLKRYQATPVTAFEFLASQVASRVMIMLFATLIIFFGCRVFLDFVVLGNPILLLLIAVIGALTMVSLGLLISCRTASEELAGGMLNMLTWPMMLLSEVWFTLDDASPLMQTVSSWLPLTHIVQAARSVMLDGAGPLDVAHHIVILLTMTLLFVGIAASLFRWHK